MRGNRVAVLLICLAVPAAGQPTAGWLSDWMGHTMSVLGNSTLLDLSLPGTHDTMTYDLSEVISDGGIDGEDGLSALFSELTQLGIGADLIGSFVRLQAVTQANHVTAQLDAGVRFLDFRIMYEYSNLKDWYCLHCVRSNQRVLAYLGEIRQWMDAHPSEVVVMWLSKHGSEAANGTDQYPNTSVMVKQGLWAQICKVFDGLMIDTSVSAVNGTSLSQLVARNHRLVVWASDWVEFTNSSRHAMNGAWIYNTLHGEPDSRGINQTMSDFAGAPAKKLELKQQSHFYLYSLATGISGTVAKDSAKLHFLAPPLVNVPETRQDCASSFGIPNMTSWCPDELLDISQLANYYAQVSLAAAFKTSGWDLPNAIYIDAVEVDGTIRTGTKPLSHSATDPGCDVFEWTDCSTKQPSCPDGFSPNGQKQHFASFDTAGNKHGPCALPWQDHYQCCRDPVAGHDVARFAYVDAFIGVNLRRVCAGRDSTDCDQLQALNKQRYQAAPLMLWHDPLTGRHETSAVMERISFVYA